MTSTPFWLGGVAASMAACCTHPLDLTKVRMQTTDAAKASVLKVIRGTIAEAGLRSLYTGLSASILRQMSYSLVRLGSYESIKTALTDGKKATSTQLLVSAGLAGALGGVAGNPADIVLVRMTSDSIKPPSQQHQYRNALQGVWELYQSGHLTRGLGPNTARAVLMNMSQLASYDYFKGRLLSIDPQALSFQLHDGLLVHGLASTMAGIVATTITSPTDVIKSRIMSSTSHESPMEVLMKSLRQEGASFLFKGWTPAFMRLGPNTVLLFVFLEQLKKLWIAQAHP